MDAFEQLTKNDSDSENSDEIFEVELILNHRTIEPKLDLTVKRLVSCKEYLVKWKGYDETYNTWEPFENLRETCYETIRDYERGLAQAAHMNDLESKLLKSSLKHINSTKTRTGSKIKAIGQCVHLLDSYPDFKIWAVEPPKDSHKDQSNLTYVLKNPAVMSQVLRIKSNDLQKSEYGKRQLCLWLEWALRPHLEQEWARLREINTRNELPGVIRMVEPDIY